MLFEPGSLVFDIGAHHGRNIQPYIQDGKAGRLVCLEPILDNFLQLSLTAAPFTDTISLIHAAAGSACGVTTIYEGADSALSTQNLELFKTIYPDAQFKSAQTVAVLSIDVLVQALGVPAYIKIDVEGMESAVLSGMSRAYADKVSYEFHRATLGDAVLSLRYLQGLGYEYASFLEDELPLSFAATLLIADCIAVLEANQPQWGNILVSK